MSIISSKWGISVPSFMAVWRERSWYTMDKKLGFPPNALVTGSFCNQGGEGHFGPPIWELDPHGWRAVTVHRENIDAWWAYGNLYSFVSQIQAYTELIHYQNVSKYALKCRHKTVGDVFPDRVKIRGCPEAKAKCLESLQPLRPWQNLSKKCWSFESFCTVFNQKKIIYMA